MAKFYHGVASEFVGTEILPLNMMKSERQDLYDKYNAKYEGRENVRERDIPLLKCDWSDVVQLLPLHPRKLFELQLELGLIDKIPKYEYFEIESSDLNADHAVVFYKTAPGDEHTEYKWLSDVNLDTLLEVPPATKDYYKSMVGTGEPVFNYQFVPHVLYKGTIDVSGVGTIRLY